MKKIAQAVAMAATFCLVIFAIVSVVFTFGPVVERLAFPVVTEVNATYLKNVDHLMQFTMTGNKRRGECVIKELQATVYTDKGPTRGTVYFKDPVSGDLTSNLHSRRGGTQSFDVWYIFPVGQSVSVRARHDCHIFWSSYTDLFTIQVGEQP